MQGSKRSVLLFTTVVAAACAPGGVEPVAPRPGTPVAALRTEFDAVFSDPAFRNAHWGVMVQSLETGEVLYRREAERLFMPASNNKLITAAVALARLGTDYRFRTRIATNGVLGDDGTLAGDLVVVGGGDPAISERFYGGDPTAPFRAWADSLKARGIERIDGDIVGDDDLYDDVHLGPGWSWDYLADYYAAEIGALLYNEGTVTYKVMPGDSAGARAEVIALPSTDYLRVDYDVTTVADSSIYFPERGPLPGTSIRTARLPFSNQARISGTIRARRDTVTRYIAAHDPTLFFVTVLKEVLEDEGIDVTGGPTDRDSLAPGVLGDSLGTLFVHQSPPLSEIVVPFLKRSQNQIGEMLLRHVGAQDSDLGSVRAGQRAVEATLSDWGITESSYIYVDGSGLSRYNYVSPDAIVRLLRVMSRRPEFEVFYGALPIAGVDGTIGSRMKGTRAENNARAKTGYIANARALSGYVTTLDGERLAFSMIANNFDVPVDAAEYLQDLAVERLANFSRGNSR